MVNRSTKIAVLFDFDGVVVDTETQYTQFWDAVGEKYLDKKNFGRLIKGTTLKQIFERYFSTVAECQEQIKSDLNVFEKQMSYDFIAGVEDFIRELRQKEVSCAIVTSSNRQKMNRVLKVHPELPTLFDAIFIAEDFKKSKPDPDCFLLGMRHFGVEPQNTIVFEDSLMGLKAGDASGALVIGITTTLTEEEMEGLAIATFPDFTQITLSRILEIKKELDEK